MKITTVMLALVVVCMLLLPTDVHADLLAKWDFNEGSGLLVNDISGNGNMHRRSCLFHLNSLFC